MSVASLTSRREFSFSLYQMGGSGGNLGREKVNKDQPANVDHTDTTRARNEPESSRLDQVFERKLAGCWVWACGCCGIGTAGLAATRKATTLAFNPEERLCNILLPPERIASTPSIAHVEP